LTHLLTVYPLAGFCRRTTRPAEQQELVRDLPNPFEKPIQRPRAVTPISSLYSPSYREISLPFSNTVFFAIQVMHSLLQSQYRTKMRLQDLQNHGKHPTRKNESVNRTLRAQK
jgi:hypothetical protein